MYDRSKLTLSQTNPDFSFKFVLEASAVTDRVEDKCVSETETFSVVDGFHLTLHLSLDT